MQPDLPIEITQVQVQGERGDLTFRISSPEEGSYNIFAESKRERKQWSTTFTDFSQFVEDTRLHLPSHILLSFIIRALYLLIEKNNKEEKLQEELLPKAEINVFNTKLLISLKIPLVNYFISYKLPLAPVAMDETELLRIQCGDMKDVTEDLQKEVKELKDELKQLKDEMKEFKEEFKESKEEVKESKEEFKESKFNDIPVRNGTPSLKLKYNDNQGAKHGCEISNGYRSVTALTGHGHRYVTTSEPLSHDCSSFWKVNVEQLNGWITIGLIGQMQASKNSYLDRTNYSWSTKNWGVFVEGRKNKNCGGWNGIGFVSGDKVFFKYEPETKILTMKVKDLGKNQAFTLKCDRLSNVYIHINIHSHNDRITLEEMTNDEEEFYFHSE